MADMYAGYGSSGMKGKGSYGMKGKGSTAQNMTYTGMNDTMPYGKASYNNYGLSSGKITKRSAK